MKRYLVLLALLPILTLFNYSIFQKERLLAKGEVVLLPLAPLDPRSLMQGDYMRLRYQLAVDAEKWLAEHGTLATTSDNQDKDGKPKSNRRAKLTVRPEFIGRQEIVFTLNEGRKAHFARVAKGQPLGAGEYSLRADVKQRYASILVTIRPDSFFFQEGKAKLYESAAFGIFAFEQGGDYLLTGLADQKGEAIDPKD